MSEEHSPEDKRYLAMTFEEIAKMMQSRAGTTRDFRDWAKRFQPEPDSRYFACEHHVLEYTGNGKDNRHLFICDDEAEAIKAVAILNQLHDAAKGKGGT